MLLAAEVVLEDGFPLSVATAVRVYGVALAVADHTQDQGLALAVHNVVAPFLNATETMDLPVPAVVAALNVTLPAATTAPSEGEVMLTPGGLETVTVMGDEVAVAELLSVTFATRL